MIKRKHIDKDSRDTFLITSIHSSNVADRVIGIIPVKSELVSVREVHSTAASTTSVLTIERLQGTEAVGSGDSVVDGTIDLEGTANTVQTGTIVTASDIHVFEAGNRVGVDVGTTTALANMVVSCYFRPIDS